MKKNYIFILFFSFACLLFLGDLIFMKGAFLAADYSEQFYPWSKILSDSVKHFEFPFWCRSFQGGFPLMAEGQVGGFYPFNVLFFFVLPFQIAYNYLVIFHFVLAGIFTYLYAKKIGCDQWGGTLAVLVFCFGSAYAGCFYNINTLKTLVWFPLVLYLFERYFESSRSNFVVSAGVILGIQLLAGFVQVAFYGMFFYFLYFLYGLKIHNRLTVKSFVAIIVSALISLVFFLPQFTLSWPLAKLSARSNASLGYALWGSFEPFNIMSMVFPSIGVYGAKFYVGVVTLIFVFCGIFFTKKIKRLRPIFMVFILGIFFALGKYNPFYVILLKLTHFYAFRNPAKFLFFSAFASSVLAGYGFTGFFKAGFEEVKARALKWSASSVGLMLVLLLALKAALYLFKDHIIAIGQWYVHNFIAGKQYHRYSIDTYLNGINSFYEQLTLSVSFKNVFILISLGLCLLTLMVCVYLRTVRFRKLIPKLLFISVLFIDLFVFSFYGTGFRGNIKSFASLSPTHSRILATLKKDNELFRVMPFDLKDNNTPNWIRPNANVLYGIDSIAAYTPLVMLSYKEALKCFEVVDDSLGLISPQIKALEEHTDLLRLLNVKYIVSPHRLENNFLKELVRDEGVYLYLFENYSKRVFLTSDLNTLEGVPAHLFTIVAYRDGYGKFEISLEKDAYLIFSETPYPGWHAYVDGNEKKIVNLGSLAQAVRVDAGTHNVVFTFKPF